MQYQTLVNEIKDELRNIRNDVIEKVMTEDVIVGMARIINNHLVNQLNSKFEQIMPSLIENIKTQIKEELKPHIIQEVKTQFIKEKNAEHMHKEESRKKKEENLEESIKDSCQTNLMVKSMFIIKLNMFLIDIPFLTQY